MSDKTDTEARKTYDDAIEVHVQQNPDFTLEQGVITARGCILPCVDRWVKPPAGLLPLTVKLRFNCGLNRFNPQLNRITVYQGI